MSAFQIENCSFLPLSSLVPAVARRKNIALLAAVKDLNPIPFPILHAFLQSFLSTLSLKYLFIHSRGQGERNDE